LQFFPFSTFQELTVDEVVYRTLWGRKTQKCRVIATVPFPAKKNRGQKWRQLILPNLLDWLLLSERLTKKMSKLKRCVNRRHLCALRF
jgi:hypothetical protein